MADGGTAHRHWEWLAHPVTVLALAVLILNDHVWKASHPGLVTGKLSDVAGLVLMPAVLGAAIGLVRLGFGRREPIGPPTVYVSAVITGVGFALVKVSPAVATVASGSWSLVVGPSQVRADVTDLVALPGLGLAVWVGLGAVVDARTRGRRASTLMALVLLPAATLAIAATSAPMAPPNAATVQVVDGRFVVGEGYGETWESLSWKISDDGGFGWRLLDPEESKSLPQDAVPREGCVPDAPEHCYRVVPRHLRVEETLDGGRSWRVTWQVTDETRRRSLAHRYDDLGDVGEYLSSRSLAVAAVPGGHGVVVANGRDGYAVRDAAGLWHRIGFGASVSDGTRVDDLPPALRRSIVDVLPELFGWILIGLLAVTVVGCIALWRAGRRWPSALAASLWATGALLTMLGALELRDGADDSWPVGPIFPPLLLAVGMVLAVSAACFPVGMSTVEEALPDRVIAALCIVGLAMTAAPIATYQLWTTGQVGYRTAGLATLAAAVTGLVSAVVVALRRSPP
jgi:hypothetical protein